MPLVVCFLLRNSPASEFYMPTFRNTLFHLHTYPRMKMKQSVPKRRHIKFRRPGNYPEENIEHTEHGESLKSRKLPLLRLRYQVLGASAKIMKSYIGFVISVRPPVCPHGTVPFPLDGLS